MGHDIRFLENNELRFSRIRHFPEVRIALRMGGLRRRSELSGVQVTHGLVTLSLNRFHAVLRREMYQIRASKQFFFSFSPYFGPSGARSAIRKALLGIFLEAAICRFQPNRAQCEVFKNQCTGIPPICAEMMAGIPSPARGLRRRNRFWEVQVSYGLEQRFLKKSSPITHYVREI